MGPGSGGGGGSGDSKQYTYQTQYQRKDPYVEQHGAQLGDYIERLKYLPNTPYPYIPYSDPNTGWTGQYKNVMTGQMLPINSNLPFTSTLAQMPAETQVGLQALMGRAMAGSPVLNAAQGNLYNTLQGQYLSPGSNPYLSGMYDAAARRMTQTYGESTQPQTDAAFSRAGAFGGSAHRLLQAQQSRDLQQGLGDLAAQMYGGQYEAERQKQLQAALVAPQMAQADYQDIQSMLAAGDIRQSDEQRKLDELMGYWQKQQQWPYQQAQIQASLLPTAWQTGGLFTSGGGTTVTDTQTQKTPLASQILGGIATGAGTLGMLAGGGLIPTFFPRA